MADQENGRLLATAREPGRMSDLYADPKAPEVYADGFGAAALGPAIARLSMFRTFDVTPSDTEGLNEMVEKRRVNLNLVMPTSSLIEFALGIAATAAANRDAFSKPNNAVAESIERALIAMRDALPKEH